LLSTVHEYVTGHIFVAYDLGHTPYVEKGLFVGTQEALMLLVPNCRLIAMTGVAECHTENPWASPLARLRMQSRRTLEEVNLRFFTWCRMKNSYDPPTLA